MAPLATAFVEVRSDGSRLKGDVVRDASRAGQQGATSFKSKFRDTLNSGGGLGKYVAGAFAGAQVAGLLKAAVSQASDLNETVAKTRNVFGDLTGSVLTWSQTSARAFGLSRQQALAAVSQFGDMFHQLGFTQGQAAKTSESLVKLAADLGSFHNVDPSDVLQRISASLRGEYDSLQQLIPNINAARVEQEALRLSHKNSVSDLTAAEKATATLAIIQRDGANAANDFAETSGGLANQQRILVAQWQDLQASLGGGLLPAMTDFVGFLNDDVIPGLRTTGHWVRANEGWLKPLAEAVLIGAAAWKAYTLAGKAAVAVTGLVGREAAVTTVALTAEGTAARNLGPMFARPGATGAAGGRFSGLGRFAAGGAGVAGLVGGGIVGGRTGGALSTLGAGALAGSALGPVGAGVGAGLAGLSLITTDQGPVHQGAQGEIRTADDKPAMMGRFTANNGGFGDPKAAANVQRTASALSKAAASESDLAGKTKTATLSLKDQAVALGNVQSKALALSGGQDALRQSMHNMAVVAGQGNRSLAGNSDAALANRDALRSAVSSGEAYIQTLKDQHVSGRKVRATQLAVAEAITKNAKATYGNTDAVIGMLRELHILPAQVRRALGSTYAIGYNAMVDVANGFADAGYEAATAVGLASGAINKNMRLGLDADQTGAKQANFIAPPVHMKYKAAGIELAGDFTDGYSKVTNEGVEEASKAAADKARQVFQQAASKMRTDVQTIIGTFRSETGSLLTAFSTLQTSGSDILGASGGAASIHSQLKQDAEQMHTFARLWHRLDRMGLDPRVLAQLAGPDYIPAMRELVASGPRGIRRDNRLERRIARDARGIAQDITEDKYGRLIHHDLDTLPPKLGREMVRALHHAKFTVDFDSGRHDRHQGRRVRQS